MAKTKSGPRYLPGDPLPTKDVERMVRVDHAGEYGAKRIYEGQLAIMGKGPMGDTIRHMAEQEQVHLDYFSGELVKRRVRPTALMPIWHAAGFALGAGTALIGEKAIRDLEQQLNRIREDLRKAETELQRYKEAITSLEQDKAMAKGN